MVGLDPPRAKMELSTVLAGSSPISDLELRFVDCLAQLKDREFVIISNSELQQLFKYVCIFSVSQYKFF